MVLNRRRRRRKGAVLGKNTKIERCLLPSRLAIPADGLGEREQHASSFPASYVEGVFQPNTACVEYTQDVRYDGGINPFRAPKSLPIQTSSNFVKKIGFPVVKEGVNGDSQGVRSLRKKYGAHTSAVPCVSEWKIQRPLCLDICDPAVLSF